MTHESTQTQQTSRSTNYQPIPVKSDTRSRLDDLKPYASISWDEFMTEVVTIYEQATEQEQNAQAGVTSTDDGRTDAD